MTPLGHPPASNGQNSIRARPLQNVCGLMVAPFGIASSPPDLLLPAKIVHLPLRFSISIVALLAEGKRVCLFEFTQSERIFAARDGALRIGCGGLGGKGL